MYVPNYIPPPEEVPHNVAQERYMVRLGFIRRVAILHVVSLLTIGGLSMLDMANVQLLGSLLEVGILLLILSLIRIATRATKWDSILSLALLPILTISLAVVVHMLDGAEYPVWGVAVGAGCSALYSVSCGRDFSFVGQFFLSLIASSVILAILAITLRMSPHKAGFLLGANGVFLSYAVYDSASLLARRRLGEEAVAVVDLYRDVFNLFGYLVRVARHWRKHRIWAR